MAVVVESYLQDVLKQMQDACREAQDEIGARITAKAKENAPVKTGELRDSIDYAIVNEALQVGAKAEHAPYVELGTSQMPAQPFLEPAALDILPEIPRIVQEHLTER